MVPSVWQLTIWTFEGGGWLPLQLNTTPSPKAEITSVYTGVYGEQALTSVSVASQGLLPDIQRCSRDNARPWISRSLYIFGVSPPAPPPSRLTAFIERAPRSGDG
jgi:hypothetical protein